LLGIISEAELARIGRFGASSVPTTPVKSSTPRPAADRLAARGHHLGRRSGAVRAIRDGSAHGTLSASNYSGYLVPTNADIPHLDVIFAGEFVSEATPLGAKGLGELTAVSVAPAIINGGTYAELFASNGLASLVGEGRLRPGRGGKRPQGNLQLLRGIC
jgi:hypothetical protein